LGIGGWGLGVGGWGFGVGGWGLGVGGWGLEAGGWLGVEGWGLGIGGYLDDLLDALVCREAVAVPADANVHCVLTRKLLRDLFHRVVSSSPATP
jgi:hypothetical protein